MIYIAKLPQYFLMFASIACIGLISFIVSLFMPKDESAH